MNAPVTAYADRLADHDVEVYFTGFGDSSINFQLRFWVAADQPSFLRGRSEAIILIKEAFDAHGITIPFPIRTLDFGASVVGGESIDKQELRLAGRG